MPVPPIKMLIKYLSITLVLLLLIGSRTFSQLEVFEDGEELYYEVSYSFINIGWAKFNTERAAGKINYFITKAKLKSNDGLPFVNVDYEFISEIEVKNGNVIPHKFTAYQLIDNKKITITHDFNYDSHYVYIKKVGLDGNTEVEKKIYTYLNYQDGLSIFYYARYNAGRNLWMKNVPVVMHVDTSLMRINFFEKKTEVSISEVDYDIASTYVDGFSYFKAVFGLTGDFSGWFSADAAKIPLKAKLQVEIGNITLELKDWKRKGWQPPKYN
jgi:hypothetical protein